MFIFRVEGSKVGLCHMISLHPRVMSVATGDDILRMGRVKGMRKESGIRAHVKESGGVRDLAHVISSLFNTKSWLTLKSASPKTLPHYR